MGFPTISRPLRDAYRVACARAQQGGAETLTLEHLAWAVLELPEVDRLLGSLGAKVPDLRTRLMERFPVATPIGARPSVTDPQPDVAVERVLQRAAIFVVSTQPKSRVGPRIAQVDGRDVLVSLLSENDGGAAEVFRSAGIHRSDVLKAVGVGE